MEAQQPEPAGVNRETRDAIDDYLKHKAKSYWTMATIVISTIVFFLGYILNQYIAWKVAINSAETSDSLRKAYEKEFIPLRTEADGDRKQIDETQIRVAQKEGEINCQLSILRKRLEDDQRNVTTKERELEQLIDRINKLTTELGQAESKLRSLSGIQNLENAGNLVDQIYDKLSKDRTFIDRFKLLPAGSVVAYPGPIIALPEWVECDGRELAINEYPLLYERLGKGLIYGQTQDKFRIPDFRGLFLRGLDPTGKFDLEASRRVSEKNEEVGARVGSLQDDQIKKHHHNLQITPGGSHSHNVSFTAAVDGPGGDLDRDPHGANNQPFAVRTSDDGEHIHQGIAVENGGIESRPKNIAVYWIMKIK